MCKVCDFSSVFFHNLLTSTRKMALAKFLLVLLLINFCSGSFINPYPRLKFRPIEGGTDVGEPLFLTPLIHAGKIEEARNLSAVRHPELNFAPSHSGYLTVDAKMNSNLFFWYFPAKTNPHDAPIVVWLQGGPGASSLFGLFTENGPFEFTESGKVTRRKYSWHLNHHLIYFDNPVGTGFSFTDDDKGYSSNESEVGINLHLALEQFFKVFPDIRGNPFWVTGESYGGKYVPALTHRIHKMNEHAAENEKINLKGMAIGNGLSDPLHQLKYGDYLFQLGLIDANGRDLFHEYEKRGVDAINKRDFNAAFDIFDELINMDQLPSGSLFKNLTGFETYFNYLKSTDSGIDDNNMGKFLQRADVRKAIHVGNCTFHDTSGENKVEEHLKLDVMDTVAPWVSEILAEYRVCIYNGQLDVIVAYPLTVNYLSQLKFKDREAYLKAPRYVWRVDKDIAGYAKEAGNLVEVMVRNAGHMVPADQPKWAMDLITRLTSGKSFAVNP
ncbi:venom serine carboxypeptidase [Lutzomyia longipalpis]|uniref:venom serine carboxypeptidase n=1 Tax=Lutzomyia longipalpis TaxID=7200 RepID=UPI00248371F1|nr:venom serine carboxypeptidase [Lutzomyia longipalpis]